MILKRKLKRSARVFVDNLEARELQKLEKGKHYRFVYIQGYCGPSVSLTMPVTSAVHECDRFPPFFEGLLPEGFMLEALLHHASIDRYDLMNQLITIGADMVGNVTVKANSKKRLKQSRRGLSFRG